MRRFYNAYVNPGALYASEVWGSFLSDSNWNKLEVCNNRAARIISGVPASSNAVATLIEARLSTRKQFSDEKAAVLYNKFLHFPIDHHLRLLADEGQPQRLKARGAGRFRPDWRITARKKIQDKPDKFNTKEYILMTREDFTLEEYRQKIEEDHIHRRICNGQVLEHSTNRNREEEVLLHRLRVNRCYKLAKTEHLLGRTELPQCRYCNSDEEEDTEHFILKCRNWAEERRITLGSVPYITVLQTNPVQVLQFIGRTGRLRPSNQL